MGWKNQLHQKLTTYLHLLLRKNYEKCFHSLKRIEKNIMFAIKGK